MALFVALKRVPDALTTVDAAKRVLREVVVLNRLDHPNIIKIFNIFFTPATTGPRRFDPETFKLLPVSIDLYMAFEIAEGGRACQILPVTASQQILSPRCCSAVVQWHRMTQ